MFKSKKDIKSEAEHVIAVITDANIKIVNTRDPLYRSIGEPDYEVNTWAIVIQFKKEDGSVVYGIWRMGKEKFYSNNRISMGLKKRRADPTFILRIAGVQEWKHLIGTEVRLKEDKGAYRFSSKDAGPWCSFDLFMKNESLE